MKLKGINPAEQHVEKIVLGVVAIVLLGVLTMQFALPSKGVTVGNQEVAPEDALDPVLEEARRTLAQMNDTEPSLPDVSQQNLRAMYDSATSGSTVPVQRIASLGAPMNLGTFEMGEAAAGGVYAMPQLPQPTEVMASAFKATVHPSEWAASEALRALLGEEQPFDLGAITVQAFIDGTAVRNALLTDADGDAGGARPLPPSWWRQGFEVLGVELERQRRMSDGSWGERTLVSGLPGRANMLSELSAIETNDPLLLVEATRFAGGEVDQITKPLFYRTIAGDRWEPPAARRASPDADNDQVQRLVRQARGLEDDIESLRDAMEDRGGEQTREPRQTGRSGRGAAGGSRSGGQTDRGGSDDSSRQDARQARLDRMVEQVAEIEAELEVLGFSIEGEPLGEEEFGPDIVGNFEPLLANDRLAMWAHDVTAQGGETYRYRLRPVFNNPAFGRQQALSEEQQDLAVSPVLPGPWSSWSEPTEALADEYYFVVNAREADALGGGPSASVELYEFYYGFYRRATLTAEPGDQFVAEARVPEGLVIYDLDNIELIDQARPAAPRGGDEGEGRSPRDRGAPGEGGGLRGTRRGEPDAPAPTRGGRGGEQADAPEIDPEVGEPALTEVPIRVDAVLLDVARVPGSGAQEEGGLVQAREEFRAFITDTLGTMLAVRLPSNEEASSVYQAVSASWRAGQRATAPDVEEEDRDAIRERRRQEREDRQPDRRPAPGGGGGGGGAG